MGLDITAYRECKLIETVKNSDEWETKYCMNGSEETVFIYPDNSFQEWREGLVDNGVYSFQEEYGFRAGSYGGYNFWRSWLCNIVYGCQPEKVWSNPEQYENKPFYRLIHFSDCEGVIGTKFCKSISKDFQDYQNVIDNLDCDEYLKEKYSDWRKAFEMASDNGFIDFH